MYTQKQDQLEVIPPPPQKKSYFWKIWTLHFIWLQKISFKKKFADKYVIGFCWDGVACEIEYTYFVILAKLTFLYSASKSSFHSLNKTWK